MFDASNNIYGPLYYDTWWSVLGAIIALASIIVIVVILFITRKKKIRSLATLKVEEPKIKDMNALREKYLGMIDQVERNFNNHMIKASVAHQRISLIVRLFYCEALGFHAEIMTLSDLKKSNYKDLIETIEKLYPDEFDTLEKGSVKNVAEEGRKLVRNL